jgi:hypothetical protein
MSRYLQGGCLIGTVVLTLVINSAGQAGTATGIVFPGLATNKLGQPNQPTASGSSACTGSAYAYAVAALDFAGGSTKQSTASASVNCTPGTGSQYIEVNTQAVNGSQSCNVFRTLPSGSAGYIGNVVCGGMILDTGQTAASTPVAPGTDQTGGMGVAGVINAQAFNANAGGNSGASAWVSAGGYLPPCGLQPCVPADSFFVQAYNGLASTFGWTLPSSSTSGYQLVYAAPTATDSGGKQAAPLGYIAGDSTVTHALFATSTQPAFRLIGTSDTTPNYYAADTTNTNSYAVTLTPPATGLNTGTVVYFKVSNANTGASTINVNTLGVKNIDKGGTTPLAPGDLLAGIIYTIIYDGVEWQLVNPSALSAYPTNQTAATGGSAASFSATANQATLFGIVIPAPGIVTSQVSYENAALDSSTHTYDIGIYAGLPSTSESPLVHIGSTAGTMFAPTSNTWRTLPWFGSTTIYLPAGRYYVAITSSCTASCATIAGQNLTVVFGTGNVSLTAGGTLSSVTTVADSPNGVVTPTFYLH